MRDRKDRKADVPPSTGPANDKADPSDRQKSPRADRTITRRIYFSLSLVQLRMQTRNVADMAGLAAAS